MIIIALRRHEKASLPMREAWIEIPPLVAPRRIAAALPVRGATMEIRLNGQCPIDSCVAPHAGSNAVLAGRRIPQPSVQSTLPRGERQLSRPCGTISIPRTPPLDSGSFIFQSTPFIGVELCRAIPSRAPACRCPREACEFPLSLVTEARCPTVDRARPTSRAFCRSSAAAEPCAAPLRSRRPAPRLRDSARSVPAGLPGRGAPF